MIDQSIVDYLCRLGLNWVQIAEELKVSRKTLLRWRLDTNYADPRPSLDGQQLDNLVLMTSRIYPNAGRALMLASVRQAGYSSKYQHVVDSMHRMDPIGCQKRKDVKGFRIPRTVYNVTKPHALWHVDSNHKLVAWNLSIVGGLDGFSRTCTFLSCSDNNYATTMLSEFILGVERYGIPSRIRTDKGGENIEIIKYMLRKRGLGRGSVITGKSTGELN